MYSSNLAIGLEESSHWLTQDVYGEAVKIISTIYLQLTAEKFFSSQLYHLYMDYMD